MNIDGIEEIYNSWLNGTIKKGLWGIVFYADVPSFCVISFNAFYCAFI